MDLDNGGTFEDRRDAGRALATRVSACLETLDVSGRPLVLALPRGGLPVGHEVATHVGGDLDVTVARKIGMPGQPEFGIGAVTADGPPLFNEETLQQVGLTEAELTQSVQRERAEARRRLRTYRDDREPADLAGRTVVVVDDGVATGVTAMAALRDVRANGPRHLIFAAPACAAESIDSLSREADAVVCVRIPEYFTAVGAWYHDFPQLTDQDVHTVLAQAWAERARAG